MVSARTNWREWSIIVTMTVDSNHADDNNEASELSAFDALKASGALNEVMAKIDT